MGSTYFVFTVSKVSYAAQLTQQATTHLREEIDLFLIFPALSICFFFLPVPFPSTPRMIKQPPSLLLSS